MVIDPKSDVGLKMLDVTSGLPEGCQEPLNGQVSQPGNPTSNWHLCVPFMNLLELQDLPEQAINASSFSLQHIVCRHCWVHQLGVTMYCPRTGEASERALWEV